MKKRRILLGVTGSIAAYKACGLITRLRRAGNDVTVVLTPAARHFVTELTFETLSGNAVYSRMFALPQTRSPIHVSLAEACDVIVICPATADIISKLANGLCDDLLTSTVVTSSKPVIICPAMNKGMYANSIIQENIKKLKRAGCTFVGPVKGRLASGDQGMGRLAPLEEIIAGINRACK